MTATSTNVSDEVIVRTTVLPHDRINYAWLILALLALALIAAGLRTAFWNNNSNQ
jgi:hypothetical protein